MSRRLRERIEGLERKREVRRWTPESHAAYVARCDAEVDEYEARVRAGLEPMPTDPVILAGLGLEEQ